MAKRKQKREEQENNAPTYKEVARARVEQRFRQRAFIAGGIIAAIVIIILLAAVVSELIVKPGQPVAVVNGADISTAKFQDQVRLYRSQYLDMVYQYAEYGLFQSEDQLLNALGQLEVPEETGGGVLDSMIDEILVRAAAAELGMSVSEDDVSEYLEKQMNYYRDGAPTPLPTNTPRPTATPITDTLPTAVPLPSNTPLPTPTAVTQEGFEGLYQDQLDMFKADGVDEASYRAYIEFQLLTEKVQEKLAEDIPAEAEQVELDVLVFSLRDETGSDPSVLASEYYTRLESGEASFEELAADAREVFTDNVEITPITWTPLEELVDRFDQATAEQAFSMELGEYSNVIVTQDLRYLIVQVTGHEVRELSASTVSAREQSLYNDWLEELRAAAEIEKYDNWVSRVPSEPEFDFNRLPQPEPAELPES